MTTTSSSNILPGERTRVPFLDLSQTYRELKPQLDAAYQRVMNSGRYVLGEELEAFETEFAAFCGAGSCAGVANGLEALTLILRAYGIGPGDEVVVPSHTFIATWLAVTHAGAVPVPVEPLQRTFNIDPGKIEAVVTARTRAVIAVHLYGQPAAMDAIAEVAARHGLRVIEDAAQAHGARWQGRTAGNLADAAAFSFYPAKNLGAYGDAGAVVSDDPDLMARVRRLRNYGAAEKYDHDAAGFNCRLDPLQAAFLRIRLGCLRDWNSRRASIAQTYLQSLSAVRGCTVPQVAPSCDPSWHLFVIRHRERDALRAWLAREGIETLIHYPIPPHLSGAYAELGYSPGALPISEQLAHEVLSLPIGPHLDNASVERVIQAMAAYEVCGE
ncbi:MAG TPA: DegT/DnrJ/EryC1/StrS family aminotransferase [Bryobacteraceae bacterium]|nr:DegT/DnrJ/EryC1/StrS family aminotransferase [Bryobacteraceae bacterium]